MRKHVVLLASFLLIASAMVFPTVASSKCFPDRYFIYENSDFGGHSRGECNSEPDLRNVEWGPWPWEDFDDAISSVKTIDQWARFYDGYNYASALAYYVAHSNVSWVGANYNDRFGSVWNGF